MLRPGPEAGLRTPTSRYQPPINMRRLLVAQPAAGAKGGPGGGGGEGSPGHLQEEERRKGHHGLLPSATHTLSFLAFPPPTCTAPDLRIFFKLTLCT